LIPKIKILDDGKILSKKFQGKRLFRETNLSGLEHDASSYESFNAEVDIGESKSFQSYLNAKIFDYKSGHIELSGLAGTMPYDLIVNHYLFGGRLSWHLSDHYGWEIADVHILSPSVSSYATEELVSGKGLSRLDAVNVNMLASTGFLLSPLYGKLRIFGSQVLYFDIYGVLGGGMASTTTTKVSAEGVGLPSSQSTVFSGWVPAVNFGFGVKLFLNRAMGLVFDFRDYLTFSQMYGKSSPKSNFTVLGGITFFLPTF
jgi:outer membrane beta-barrel protein